MIHEIDINANEFFLMKRVYFRVPPLSLKLFGHMFMPFYSSDFLRNLYCTSDFLDLTVFYEEPV